MKSAGVSESGFTAAFAGSSTRATRRFKHGQRKGALSVGTHGAAKAEDNHQSPLKPSNYLELRVEPMLAYYQTKLPRCYRRRFVMELTLVLGGLVSSVLAFYKLHEWIPVVASFTAVVSGWLEFDNTAKKLSRYNDTVAACRNTTMWWESLGDVEKANKRNIEKLTREIEGAFRVERQAWSSTFMVHKQMDEKTKTDLSRTLRLRGVLA